MSFGLLRLGHLYVTSSDDAHWTSPVVTRCHCNYLNVLKKGFKRGGGEG